MLMEKQDIDDDLIFLTYVTFFIVYTHRRLTTLTIENFIKVTGTNT